MCVVSLEAKDRVPGSLFHVFFKHVTLVHVLFNKQVTTNIKCSKRPSPGRVPEGKGEGPGRPTGSVIMIYYDTEALNE